MKKKLNDPAEKVKLVSTKGLTKDLINNYSILNGGKYFGENGSENYLVFQPCFTYLTRTDDKIVLWQSKEMSEESIAPPSTTNYRFAAKRIGKYSISTIKFNGDCSKQNSMSFIHCIKFIYFVQIRCMIKRFKHRLYAR